MIRDRARWQRTAVLMLLVALSLAAWIYMLKAHDHSTSLAPMHPHPATAKHDQVGAAIDIASAFRMWAVMMIAMMTPSVMPRVLGLIRIRQRQLGLRHPYLAATAFLAGYFAVWLLFCALTTAAQYQLQALALLSPRLESHNTWLSAALPILAGLYQFTPWKATCLKHCRTVDAAPAHGRRSAARVGLHHGASCVGSCWALMLMMFAVGVLNLLWMGLLTLAVVLEKSLPSYPRWLRYATGTVLLLWGGWRLAAVMPCFCSIKTALI